MMSDGFHIQVRRREQPGDEAAIRRVKDQAFGQREESQIGNAVRAGGGPYQRHRSRARDTLGP